jgi:hypothetical protein
MSRRFRVLTCDQDPAVNGAIGHLLGVSFRTPALLDQRVQSVGVEIVGEYITTSSLMAPLQGEPFAAAPYSRRPFAPPPTVVVTLSGIGDALRETVRKIDVPVVCLSELSTTDPNEESGYEKFTCPIDHSCAECVAREFSGEMTSIRVAELCTQFAILFTRNFGQREG